jgi:RES domain-containing protein
MRLFRLANKVYANDLSGAGGLRFAGRWHPKGTPCLYTSQALSLALLEKFVHAQATEQMLDLHLLTIDLPQVAELYTVDVGKMPVDWAQRIDYTQWIGNQLLNDASILGFVVPSAIVPTEFNVVLNPRAKLFGTFGRLRSVPYAIDERLVLKLT